MKVHRFLRRVPWRYAWVLVPVVGVAAVAGIGWLVMRDTVRQARIEEQRRGTERAGMLFDQAQRLLTAQRQERLREREAVQTRLEQRVTALAGDAQVFLHAALIEHRSVRMRERNERLHRRVDAFREATALLAGAAHAQDVRNQELRRHIQTVLSHVVAGSPSTSPARQTPSSDAGGGRSGSPAAGHSPPKTGASSSSPGNAQVSPTAAESGDGSETPDAETTVRLPARILMGMRELLEPGASAADVDPLAGVSKTLEPLLHRVPEEPEADPRWAETLLRHCGLDLESLLPETGSLKVTEVGGRVLLHLGAEEVSPEALVAEASRTLLFEGEGAQVNWTVSLRLVVNDPPRPPTPEEMALHLSEQLRFDEGTLVADAFFVDGDGVVQAVFPHPARVGVPVLPPEAVWIGEPMRGRMVWYEQRPCHAPYGWAMGVRVRMPDAPDGERILETLRVQPAYAVGWVTLGLGTFFLLGGVVFMAWPRGSGNGSPGWRGLGHRGGGGGMRGPVLVADLDAGSAPVVPVPGSLHRLQTENRGHRRGGSQILEHARSPVLRDLARKVRTPEGTPTRISAAFVRARPKKAEGARKTGGTHHV